MMSVFSSMTSRLFTFFTISLLSFSFGADLTIVHMDGVFDLSNDALVECMTIEEGRGDVGITDRIEY